MPPNLWEEKSWEKWRGLGTGMLIYFANVYGPVYTYMFSYKDALDVFRPHTRATACLQSTRRRVAPWRSNVIVFESLRFRRPHQDKPAFSKVSLLGDRKRRLRVDGLPKCREKYAALYENVCVWTEPITRTYEDISTSDTCGRVRLGIRTPRSLLKNEAFRLSDLVFIDCIQLADVYYCNCHCSSYTENSLHVWQLYWFCKVRRRGHWAEGTNCSSLRRWIAHWSNTIKPFPWFIWF